MNIKIRGIIIIYNYVGRILYTVLKCDIQITSLFARLRKSDWVLNRSRKWFKDLEVQPGVQNIYLIIYIFKYIHMIN